MLSSAISNSIMNLVISLAIDAVIINIIYSTIRSGVSYLKNVIIYMVCLQVKLMLFTGIVSIGMFLLAAGIYFAIGLLVIWILTKLADYFSRISFIVIGIIVQSVVAWLIGLII